MRKRVLTFLIVIQLSFCPAVFSGAFQDNSTKFVKRSFPAFHIPLDYGEFLRNKKHHSRPSYSGEELVNWIKSNTSPETGLSLSFKIAEEKKDEVYAQIGDPNTVEGVIERMIVEDGLVIYDGAVAQIVLSVFGQDQDLDWAENLLEVYWDGKLGKLSSIRAGGNFIYEPRDPSLVSGDPEEKGRRGFIYRIINAHGEYNAQDPLDGKMYLEGFPNLPRIHWEDWKPVAGENAWVTMAAMHLYHRKYYDPETQGYQFASNSVEYQLAEEIARAALFLQVENGGIRMAPLGTHRNEEDFADPEMTQGEWWYNQISTENNISWYAAFRMLYQVTGDEIYKKAMEDVEHYFKQVFNAEGRYFYQGMNFKDGVWEPNAADFALDVQTWAIDAIGPETIDEWFGQGTAYEMWKTGKENSGYFDHGKIAGVGYTFEHDQISVEWTAGAILALQLLEDYYRERDPDIVREIHHDRIAMRQGIERLRTNLSPEESAYSYSLKRKYIPFGWYAHSADVLSLASTGWVVMIDNRFNPFELNM